MGLVARGVPAAHLPEGGTASRRLAPRRTGVSFPRRGLRRARFRGSRFGAGPTLVPRLGAHMSIAGGLPRAVDRARASRCQALQIFTKSAGQWRARPLPAEEIALFREKVSASGISPVVAHNSYLINLATAQPELRAQSNAALGEEIDRAE